MKNLVLASALGTLAGTFAAPALRGPIHYQVTKPFSMFALAQAPAALPSTVTLSLGTVPSEFIMTDVIIGNTGAIHAMVKANGTPVFCAGGSTAGANYVQTSTHLTTGIPIAAGATITIDVTWSSSFALPVTLAGYLQ